MGETGVDRFGAEMLGSESESAILYDLLVTFYGVKVV